MTINKKSTKPKAKPVASKPATVTPAPAAPADHQEFQCANEYHEQCSGLFSALMAVSAMSDLDPTDIALCLFQVGQIVLGPEACDDCVADTFAESRQLAADFFDVAEADNEDLVGKN